MGSCDFTIDEGQLGGTCGGDDRFPVTGHVEGRMEFEGELDDAGTAINGTCTIGDQAGTFTMTKKR